MFFFYSIIVVRVVKWYNILKVIEMASISVVKTRDNEKYVYLKESYRVKDKVKTRVLVSYGKLSDLEAKEPGILDRLRAEAKAGLLTGKTHETLEISFDLDTAISYGQKNYGWMLLDDIYRELGIAEVLKAIKRKSKYDIDEILRLLVFGRILSPHSKSRTVREQSLLYGKWGVEEHQMYRALSLFCGAKEDIQLAIHQNVCEKIGRSATLVFYDVTNYYFETDMDDEDIFDEESGELIEEGFRRRGPSKEKRPKPIVQMGLFMDANGIPICHKLFRGNLTDPSTYLPAIEQVKRQFGIERVVVVADKAMNSAKNVTAMKNTVNETTPGQENTGDGWLFSQKHRGSRGVPKVIQDFVLDETGWEYSHDLTFAKKSMIRKRKLSDGQHVDEKVVVTWRKKYAVREKLRRDGALEYIESLTNPERFRASCKKGGKKYLEMYELDEVTGEKKPLSPFLDIDREKVKYDEQFDGINVLVTSETSMGDEEIIEHYHELSKIEDCFRITKTEFDARPVFVRLRDHIEAHFLTCFISLVILRIIQHMTEYRFSVERICTALSSATVHSLGKGYEHVQANDDMKQLNNHLKINWEQAYVKTERLNKYAQGCFTTFFSTLKRG